MEPALFVDAGFILRIAGTDLHAFFRYYLPILVSILTVPVAYVIGKRLTGSNYAGIAAAVLFAVSNLQIEAVNESYYKQLFSMVVLFGAIYGLDRYLQGQDKRYLLPSVLAAGSLFYYHRPASMTFFLLMLVLIGFCVLRKKWKTVLSVLKITLLSLVVSLPAVLPRWEIELDYFYSFLTGTLKRVGMLGTSEGRIYGGGAIPAILQGFDYVLAGYVLIFAPLVILAAYSCYNLWKKKESLLFVAFAVLLLAYVGLWFYFGNRIIFELDLLAALLAAHGLFVLVPIVARNRGNVGLRKKATVAIILSVFLAVASLGFVYQSDKMPYIVNNLEGVEWIDDNVGMNDSVIFAPAYLSSNLIQKGYRVATWDYTLTYGQERPEYIAEEFMTKAPSNITYVRSFLDSHPEFSDLRIFVLWGDVDLRQPLPRSGQFIPFGEYEESPWFELSYEGRDEILRIYEFMNPF